MNNVVRSAERGYANGVAATVEAVGKAAGPTFGAVVLATGVFIKLDGGFAAFVVWCLASSLLLAVVLAYLASPWDVRPRGEVLRPRGSVVADPGDDRDDARRKHPHEHASRLGGRGPGRMGPAVGSEAPVRGEARRIDEQFQTPRAFACDLKKLSGISDILDVLRDETCNRSVCRGSPLETTSSNKLANPKKKHAAVTDTTATPTRKMILWRAVAPLAHNAPRWLSPPKTPSTRTSARPHAAPAAVVVLSKAEFISEITVEVAPPLLVRVVIDGPEGWLLAGGPRVCGV